MDCLEGMKQLDDNSIDLVLTDPPYNIGKNIENDSLNEQEFLFFHTKYLFELKRVTKEKHPIAIFFNNGSNLKDYLSIAGSILSFKRLITLYKPNDCSYPMQTMLRTSEACLVFSDNGVLNYEGSKNIHDVLTFNHVKLDKTFYHPTVKNINCIMKLIEAFTSKGNVILDPFIGSGTTAVACKRLDRQYIGFEINPEYCNIAQKRIDNVPEHLEQWITITNNGGENK